MATTIDYTSDYYGEASDYQTTMKRICPLIWACSGFQIAKELGREKAYLCTQCPGPCCAWWDAMAERCAVLSLARNK